MSNFNVLMKKYDLVSVVGTLVCLVALAGIFVWNSTRPAPLPAPQTVQQPQVQAPTAPAVTSQENVNGAGGAAAANSAVAPPPLKLPPVVEPTKIAIAGQGVLSVDPTGLGVKAVTLEKYLIQTRDASKAGDKVCMETAIRPFLGLTVAGTTLYEAAPGIATLSEPLTQIQTSRTDSKRAVTYSECWVTPQGDSTLGEYEMKYILTVTNNSGSVVRVPKMSLSCGALEPFLSDESNTSFASGASGSVAVGRAGKDSAKIFNMKEITKKMKADKVAEFQAMPVDWIAVSSKYFMFAIRKLTLDNQPVNFTGFEANSPAGLKTERFHAVGILPELVLAPGESKSYTVTAYAGPKNYQRLQAMGHGIESIMGMDLFFFWHFKWMGWICRILLESLNYISGWFPPSIAYGMGIILVTILVKLIFMPLSWKSTRDMKKMSAVQPQLKALREKYKGDTQRLYYEQQKLFKENNVSQLGGCLPMLVQIPVFFAMFNTFRAAIEIRNAGFLWVDDLSMPDPIFGLPIHPLALLTGVTMFIQQKLTPMPDPNQARMMSFMSLVFVVFFYNMPAGLTLYMTVNQLFSIGQMYFFRRMEKKANKAA